MRDTAHCRNGRRDESQKDTAVSIVTCRKIEPGDPVAAAELLSQQPTTKLDLYPDDVAREFEPLKCFVVNGNSHLTAGEGQRAAFVTNNVRADARMTAVAMGQNETGRVASELPYEINPGEM